MTNALLGMASVINDPRQDMGHDWRLFGRRGVARMGKAADHECERTALEKRA